VFLIFAAIGILVVGGAAAFLAGPTPRRASRIGAGAVYTACAVCALGLMSVWTGRSPAVLRLPWSVPFGSLSFALDPLSTWFILPLLPLAAACAAYGSASMETEHGATASDRRAGAAWFFLDLLIASLFVVLTARNAILFLVAWEVMALASFFLVTWEDDRREVREAGWVYLVATHVGTAFLLAFFAILGTRAHSLEFDALSLLPAGALGGACFLMAVAGFGTKAGFVPFHVWLPEAHPAAPSHVSALMSGLMIKTGIYGLLRALEFLGAPEAWWGWLLLGIGLVSGVFGVAFALVQHDLKRLLAYSSIENMGLVALGLGLGVLGLVAGAPVVATLGFAAALVHVLNHALFKGLLFLAAGSVLHATGRLDLDGLGGLLRRMPRTGACALVGGAAIAGLPPLGGFVGEFLLFLAALQATLTPALAVPGVTVLVGVALVAGLAAAAFTKVVGIGFLGHARSPEAASAHESDGGLTRPMLALALACLVAGFAWTWPFSTVFGGGPGGAARPLPAGADLGAILAPTWTIPMAGGILVALVGLLAWTRRRLLRGRLVRRSVTWDCGYAHPDARMQYTGSSYVLPLAELFQPLVRTRTEFAAPSGLFPGPSRLRTTTPALFRTLLYEPAFDRLRATLQRLKWLQHGRLQLYVLYIVVVFVVLLVWHAGSAP
jgi:formate hydrogenlyase subunit 3/multisubunit Na+/H+ antiporter MnhD subunit